MKRSCLMGYFYVCIFSVLDCAHVPEVFIHCIQLGEFRFVPSLDIVVLFPQYYWKYIRTHLPCICTRIGVQKIYIEIL